MFHTLTYYFLHHKAKAQTHILLAGCASLSLPVYTVRSLEQATVRAKKRYTWSFNVNNSFAVLSSWLTLVLSSRSSSTTCVILIWLSVMFVFISSIISVKFMSAFSKRLILSSSRYNINRISNEYRARQFLRIRHELLKWLKEKKTTWRSSACFSESADESGLFTDENGCTWDFFPLLSRGGPLSNDSWFWVWYREKNTYLPLTSYWDNISILICSKT